jgi:hypothetical protein
MKTPMQEVFAHLRASKEDDSLGAVMTARLVGYAVDWLLENERSLLEKEKEVMCEFADDYQRNCFQKSSDDYYNETFKTKEK